MQRSLWPVVGLGEMWSGRVASLRSEDGVVKVPSLDRRLISIKRVDDAESSISTVTL